MGSSAKKPFLGMGDVEEHGMRFVRDLVNQAIALNGKLHFHEVPKILRQAREHMVNYAIDKGIVGVDGFRAYSISERHIDRLMRPEAGPELREASKYGSGLLQSHIWFYPAPELRSLELPGATVAEGEPHTMAWHVGKTPLNCENGWPKTPIWLLRRRLPMNRRHKEPWMQRC